MSQKKFQKNFCDQTGAQASRLHTSSQLARPATETVALPSLKDVCLVLRLCRLMCGKALPFRKRFLIGVGLRPVWGRSPSQQSGSPESRRLSAYQAAKPQEELLTLLLLSAEIVSTGRFALAVRLLTGNFDLVIAGMQELGGD